MKKINKAFSIIEVMIIITIIGFILILEMQVINHRRNQYSNTYYSVYNSLRKVSYNILADNGCPDCTGSTHLSDPDDPTSQLICDATGEPSFCPDGPRAFPADEKEFCKRIADFYNTIDEPDCEMDPIVIVKTTSVSDLNQFDDDHLAFQTTNSLKFYVSKRGNHTVDSKTINYFLVYVDLNGSKNPNTISHHEGGENLPDIVPFLITERGEVLPVGFPIYSTTYLSAKIKYPFLEVGGNPVEDLSRSLSFYEATQAAWQSSEHPDITFAWELNEKIFPKSMLQIKLREKNSEGQMVDVDYPDLENSENSYAKAVKRIISEGRNKGCAANTFNCRVIVDGNIDTRF